MYDLCELTDSDASAIVFEDQRVRLMHEVVSGIAGYLLLFPKRRHEVC